MTGVSWASARAIITRWHSPSDMRSMVLRAKADIPTRRSERSTTARSASCMRPIQLV